MHELAAHAYEPASDAAVANADERHHSPTGISVRDPARRHEQADRAPRHWAPRCDARLRSQNAQNEQAVPRTPRIEHLARDHDLMMGRRQPQAVESDQLLTVELREPRPTCNHTLHRLLRNTRRSHDPIDRNRDTVGQGTIRRARDRLLVSVQGRAGFQNDTDCCIAGRHVRSWEAWTGS